jgi:hypothetical protein
MRDSTYSDKWKAAEVAELKAILDMGTFVPVRRSSLDPKHKPIPTKMVYKVKKDRLKARLVVIGSRQHPSTYGDTFAPTPSLTALRTIIKIAQSRGYQLHVLDVSNAFCHASADRLIYILLPMSLLSEPHIRELLEPYLDPDMTLSDTVFLLNKSLYGIHQAPKLFNDDVDAELKRSGLVRSQLDSCVYFNSTKTFFVITYVDDILAVGCDSDIAALFRSLKSRYKIRDLGRPTLYIGIQFSYSPNSVLIHQHDYIQQALDRFDQTHAKPAYTPLPTDVNLALPDPPATPEIMANYPFRELVGTLMYAFVATRPDIGYAVSQLSRFNNNYTKYQWNLALRVLRYLGTTASFGLRYSKTSEPQLNLRGYTDASFASDPDYRTSVSGRIITLNNDVIDFASSGQKHVSRSSCEAEYYALGQCTQQVLYLRLLLHELGFPQLNPTPIFIDNTATITTAQNPTTNKNRTRHIDVAYHFVRQRISDKYIILRWISTIEQLADILTKALGQTTFDRLRAAILSSFRN